MACNYGFDYKFCLAYVLVCIKDEGTIRPSNLILHNLLQVFLMTFHVHIDHQQLMVMIIKGHMVG